MTEGVFLLGVGGDIAMPLSVGGEGEVRMPESEVPERSPLSNG